MSNKIKEGRDKLVGLRLRERREAAGLTQEDVAEVCGVAAKTVSRWESGSTSLPVEKLFDLKNLGYKLDGILAPEPLGDYTEYRSKLAKEGKLLNRTNMSDHMVAEGNLEENSSDNTLVPDSEQLLGTNIDFSIYRAIPTLNVNVSAGNGAENGHEAIDGALAFRRQYLLARGLHAADLRVLYAKGDSMEPEIQDGAAMLVNVADTRLDEGCIYIIRLGDHLFAKRIQRTIDGSVRLVSVNHAYPPMEIKQDQLQDMSVQGRVVWSGREH